MIYTNIVTWNKSDLLLFLKKTSYFSALDDANLLSLLERVSVYSCPAGGVLYTQGSAADGVYLILSGEMQLVREDKEKRTGLQTLTAGDLLGEEGLRSGKTRLTDARAASPSEVLYLPGDDYRDLAHFVPELVPRFQIAYETLQRLVSTPLPWREEGECVTAFVRRNNFFLWARILPPVILGAIVAVIAGTSYLLDPHAWILALSLGALLIGGGTAAWLGVDWGNDYFVLTNRRAVILEKVILLYESRQESPLEAILGTGIDSTFIGRWMGFGNLYIKTYTGSMTFKNASEPQALLRLVDHLRHRARKERERKEQNHIREALQQRLNHPDRQPPAGRPRTDGVEVSSSGLMEALANLFRLKQTVGNSFVYRTHWIFVLLKTALPSLIMFIAGVVIMLRYWGGLEGISAATVYMVGFSVAMAGWLFWIYEFLDWRNDIYVITPDQIADINRKPMGKEDRREAPIKNIQSINFQRKGLPALILNYGTVNIQIGNEKFTFDNVYNPSEVQRQLFKKFLAYQENSQAAEREQMADWLEAYQELTTEPHKKDEIHP